MLFIPVLIILIIRAAIVLNILMNAKLVLFPLRISFGAFEYPHSGGFQRVRPPHRRVSLCEAVRRHSAINLTQIRVKPVRSLQHSFGRGVSDRISRCVSGRVVRRASNHHQSK